MVLAYVKKEALIRKSETKKEKKMRKWIDMHCDTLSELLSAETLEENSLCVDRKRMEQTKMLAEFLHVLYVYQMESGKKHTRR